MSAYTAPIATKAKWIVFFFKQTLFKMNKIIMDSAS